MAAAPAAAGARLRPLSLLRTFAEPPLLYKSRCMLAAAVASVLAAWRAPCSATAMSEAEEADKSPAGATQRALGVGLRAVTGCMAGSCCWDDDTPVTNNKKLTMA